MNHELKIGTRIRLIRRPNFGKIGTVSKLHEQPVVIETGSKVRVLSVNIENGNEVTVPRANVEIIGDTSTGTFCSRRDLSDESDG